MNPYSDKVLFSAEDLECEEETTYTCCVSSGRDCHY